MQARIKRGLLNNPTLKIEESSDKAFTAFNISIKTKTDKDNVDAFVLP
jgi:hypothetical protein